MPIAFESAEDDPVQLGRDFGPSFPDGRDRFGDRLGHDGRRAVVVVRGTPGEQIIEGRTDGVHVRVVPDRFAANLLRGREQDRAQERPGLGQLGGPGGTG